MLSADSPLRRLPADLPRRQILFTDALRLSAEMAGLSFQNLEDLLKSLVVEKGRDNVKGVAVEAVVHAYGVVDAANRFRAVLRNSPGLKQNTQFQLFMRQTVSVESLRNVIQHLNVELRSIGEQQSAPLGTITWLGPSPNEESPPTSWVLQPGSFYRGQVTVGPMMDLESRMPLGQIGHVHLVSSGVHVDLSDTVERIRVMITSLEPAVRERALGKKLLGTDVLQHHTLTPIPDATGAPEFNED